MQTGRLRGDREGIARLRCCRWPASEKRRQAQEREQQRQSRHRFQFYATRWLLSQRHRNGPERRRHLFPPPQIPL